MHHFATSSVITCYFSSLFHTILIGEQYSLTEFHNYIMTMCASEGLLFLPLTRACVVHLLHSFI